MRLVLIPYFSSCGLQYKRSPLSGECRPELPLHCDMFRAFILLCTCQQSEARKQKKTHNASTFSNTVLCKTKLWAYIHKRWLITDVGGGVAHKRDTIVITKGLQLLAR